MPLAFAKDGQNVFDRAAAGEAQEREEVLARAAARVEVHQHRGDDDDVELGLDALAGRAEQVIEVAKALEPAEEELDLPALPVQEADRRGRDVGVEVADEAESLQLAADFGLDDRLAEEHLGSVRAAGDEASRAIADDAGGAVGFRQGERLGLVEVGRVRAGLAIANHEPRERRLIGLEVGAD